MPYQDKIVGAAGNFGSSSSWWTMSLAATTPASAASRSRTASELRAMNGRVGARLECPDLRFGTLPPIDAVESPMDERDDKIHKNRSTPGNGVEKTTRRGGFWARGDRGNHSLRQRCR